MARSVPQIPIRSSNAPEYPLHSAIEAADLLARFLLDAARNTLVLTGAGVSVDSGIRAYRGPQGSYTIRKTYRPIFYHEFVSSHTARQRYWARSFLGYPEVQKAASNRTHFAISSLQYLGHTPQIITQNVDRLHHQAASSEEKAHRILELHGSLKHTKCQNCGHTASRDHVQEQLTNLNPSWAAYASEIAATGKQPSTNPDGDVDLQGRSYDSFAYPDCEACGTGPIKPAVVFFGENISIAVKSHAADLVSQASAMLVVGSALATYSAFKLVKAAVDAGLPLCLLNLGPSRADEFFPGSSSTSSSIARLRFDLPSTDVLNLTAARLAEDAPRHIDQRTLNRLLTSGVTRTVDPIAEPAG